MRIFVLSIIQKGAFSFGKLCQQCSNLWSLTVQFWDRNFFRVIHISNRTLKLPNCDNDCIRILIKLHFNIFRTSWYWRDSIHCTYSEGRRSSEKTWGRRRREVGKFSSPKSAVKENWPNRKSKLKLETFWEPSNCSGGGIITSLPQAKLRSFAEEEWLSYKYMVKKKEKWAESQQRGRSQKRAKKSHNEHPSSSSHSVSSSKYDGECL